MIQFTLYSRSYCHLCDDMLEALHGLQKKHLFEIDVIDVDEDEVLVTQYDELVPVLIARCDGAEPLQLCHYFLDEIKVEAYLLRNAPR